MVKIVVRTSMLISFIKNSKRIKNRNTASSNRGEFNSPQAIVEYTTGDPPNSRYITLILKDLQNHNHEHTQEHEGDYILLTHI